MPFHLRDDGKPVVAFEPALEISPFALFRRLAEGGELLLVDVRAAATGRSLRGAVRLPGERWRPPADLDVVLFDDDGSSAVEMAARLIQSGHPRVRALFGGLELYEFSLDPQVVGAETFLVDATGEEPAPGGRGAEGDRATPRGEGD